MKTYQTVEVKQCDEIQCDKCARVAKRDGEDYEFQEFVSIAPKSYSAIFGKKKNLKKSQLGIASLMMQALYNQNAMI